MMNTSMFFNYPVQDDSDPGQQPLQLTFLSNWSDDEWSRLLEHAQMQLYEAGQEVIRAGSSEQVLYMIAAGSLEVRMKQRGRDTRVATIEAGSVIGEQSFFDGMPRSASVIALTACQVLHLSRDSFDIFGARQPRLAREFLLDLGRILSLRLRSLQGTL
jgi:CRP/FNR family cyclic AMP-dependent transcriptional regulator